MEWIKKLTKTQVVILLIIGGITSLIALDGLSDYRTDYYVSAAISRAFFSTILMLVLASPFLYIFRKKEKVEKEKTNGFHLPKITIGLKRIFIAVFALLALGIFIGMASYKNSQDQVKKAELTSNNCARMPVYNPQVQVIYEPFDPAKPPEGEKFYKHSADEAIWTQVSFDVDGDNKPEDIMTANTAMNHIPHVLRIVKDGYIVFKYDGVGLYAKAVSDHKGFILGETLDWNTDSKRQTRYNYISGRVSGSGFKPIWYQENCNFE